MDKNQRGSSYCFMQNCVQADRMTLKESKYKYSVSSSLKIGQLIVPVKDPLGLEIPGVYHIPRTCGQTYKQDEVLICAVRRASTICVWGKRIHQPWQNMIGEQVIKSCSPTQKGCFSPNSWSEQIIRESFKIRSESFALNREDGLKLSLAWLLLLDLIKPCVS